MEDKRNKERYDYFKVHHQDALAARSNFMVSLRKKQKQEVFKRRRNLNKKLPEEDSSSVPTIHKTLKDAFEEIVAITSSTCWSSRVLPSLKSLNNLFSDLLEDDTKLDEIDEFLELVQVPETFHLILSSGLDLFKSKNANLSLLHNTLAIISLYSMISEGNSKNLPLFMMNCPELPKTLKSILKGSLKVLNSSKMEEQQVYFQNLLIDLIVTLANLVIDFEEEFEDITNDADIYKEIYAWVQSEIPFKGLETLSWYFSVLMNFKIGINLAEVILNIYANILQKVILQRDISVLDDDTKRVLTQVIYGLHMLLGSSESVVREFIANEMILEYTLEILNETIKLKSEYDKIHYRGAGILQILSSYEFDQKYSEKGVYKTLFKLLFESDSTSVITAGLTALSNFSILSSHVNKAIIDKSALLYLIDKAIASNHPILKYETILFLSTLLDMNRDDDKFLVIMFGEQEMIGQMTDVILDALNEKESNLSLMKLGLDFIDNLLKCEENYYESNQESLKYQEPLKYSEYLVEKGLVEKIDFLESKNTDIYSRAQKLRIKYQLGDIQDIEDFLNEEKHQELITNAEF